MLKVRPGGGMRKYVHHVRQSFARVGAPVMRGGRLAGPHPAGRMAFAAFSGGIYKPGYMKF
ncbi:hypothetical protein DCC81_20055 [Chitinophaga parva]|uniref:Uncharacterized protein n=1 Tax=Chitinophaga parva TaxID=2169414 RepID=A0A2T7BCC5_9BACT|nr:hypothetical protein DCC81_20055 [Chitinophaga parva]